MNNLMWIPVFFLVGVLVVNISLILVELYNRYVRKVKVLQIEVPANVYLAYAKYCKLHNINPYEWIEEDVCARLGFNSEIMSVEEIKRKKEREVK